MKFRFFGPLMAGLLMATPAVALNIDVTEFALGNGMQVVVIPDARAPVVTHMVWYKVGAADEPKGKAGIAHFFEHLMFKGTVKYPGGEFSRLVRVNGGEENAFTTQDHTAYFQRIAKEHLGLMMALEADRMQNLVLTDQNVTPELLVVQEERRQRTDNNPASLLGEQIEAALFTAHPYGKPTIGWMSEVMQLSKNDAVAFYRAHYTPANAVLVVAGDVTSDQVKALAEKYYGGLKNTVTVGPRLRTPEPQALAERRVIMKDARAASPNWQRNYLAPARGKAKGREALALDLLADILGGGSRARLYQKLVIEQKIVAHAGAWYSGDGLDYGSFGFYAAPNPGVDMAKLEAAVDAVIAEVLREGVTTLELTETRNKVIAESIYLLDSQQSLAQMFGTALVTGHSVADVLNWERDIAAVTVDDIRAAAIAVLDVRASVTGILLPETAAQN